MTKSLKIDFRKVRQGWRKSQRLSGEEDAAQCLAWGYIKTGF